MHLEQAIRDAVEKGGYDLRKNPYSKGFEPVPCEILLDANFWRALGKARWWTPQGGTGRSYHDEYGDSGYPSMYDWQIKWHRFIDHLIAGGDIESFFRTLREGITGNEHVK